MEEVTSVRQAAAVQRLAARRPALALSWTDSGAAMDAIAAVGGLRPHQIPSDDGAAIADTTAPLRDGMRDVVAPDAADSRARQRGPVGEHGRNSGYLSRYGNSSSTRSMRASRSGRCSGDLGLTSNQVWGLTKTDLEWSEKLDTALNAARRSDLKHGTNAAYVHGCVCSECREHQQIRMGRSHN
jgi:hypothetical protein